MLYYCQHVPGTQQGCTNRVCKALWVPSRHLEEVRCAPVASSCKEEIFTAALCVFPAVGRLGRSPLEGAAGRRGWKSSNCRENSFIITSPNVQYKQHSRLRNLEFCGGISNPTLADCGGRPSRSRALKGWQLLDIFPHTVEWFACGGSGRSRRQVRSNCHWGRLESKHDDD